MPDPASSFLAEIDRRDRARRHTMAVIERSILERQAHAERVRGIVAEEMRGPAVFDRFALNRAAEKALLARFAAERSAAERGFAAVRALARPTPERTSCPQ